MKMKITPEWLKNKIENEKVEESCEAGVRNLEHGDIGGWCETHETTGTWCSVCQQYTYRCCSSYGTCGCS